MTEETVTLESTTTDQSTPAEPEAAAVNVRETPAFKGVTQQLEKAKNELAAFKAEQADAIKASTQAKLAEEGNYTESMRLKQVEVDGYKAAAADATLTAALAMKGMTNPAGVAYARTLYTHDGEQTIEDFVGEYMERPEIKIMLTPHTGTPLPAANAAAGAPRSTTNGTLTERMASPDVEVARAARLEYTAGLGLVTKG